MVVSAWILILAVVVIVAVITLLGLVIRRALTELFFWRGAFKWTNDRAYQLLQQADESCGTAAARAGIEAGHGAPGLPCDAERRNGHSAGDEVRDVPLRRYSESVDAVVREARRLKIDWVTQADVEYFHAQHMKSPAESPD